MSEPNGKSVPIDIDTLGRQLIERAEWMSLNGDDVTAGVLLRARRAIGILLSQVPQPAPTEGAAPSPAAEVSEGQ